MNFFLQSPRQAQIAHKDLSTVMRVNNNRHWLEINRLCVAGVSIQVSAGTTCASPQAVPAGTQSPDQPTASQGCPWKNSS